MYYTTTFFFLEKLQFNLSTKLSAVLQVVPRTVNAWTLSPKLPIFLKNAHFVEICL
jgi:hypothetical protein